MATKKTRKYADSTDPNSEGPTKEELRKELLGEEEEEDQPEASQAPLHVMQVNDTLAFIKARGNIRATDLKKTYAISNVFDLPKTARGVSIDKVNDNLHYMWLGVDDLKEPEWNNYVPVVRGNDGAAGIHSRAFLPDGTIMVGKHYLCWTTKEYHLSRRLDPRLMMNQAIHSFLGEHSKQEGTNMKHSSTITNTETETDLTPAATTVADQRPI